MAYALTDTLVDLLGETRNLRSINAMFHCPLHEDQTPSLSANQEEGLWKCHSCGASGGIEHLAKLVGEELGDDFRWDRAIASVKDSIPYGPTPNFREKANQYYVDGLTGDGRTAIENYMRKRNIVVDAHHQFWIGWTGRAIALPYWEDDSRRDGNCVGIRYRDRHGNRWSEAGTRRAIYNVEDIRGAATVLICEGESDTQLAWSHTLSTGIRVCGIPGASVSRSQWELWSLDFLWASRIMVALDADEAGDKGADLAMSVLGEKAVRVRPDPDTDGHDLVDHFKKWGKLPDAIFE